MVLVSRTGKKESSQKPTWLLLMEGETMSKFNSNAVSGSRQRIKLNQKPILFSLIRILQLQQLVVDVQSKMNHDRKEREVDETELSKR